MDDAQCLHPREEAERLGQVGAHEDAALAAYELIYLLLYITAALHVAEHRAGGVSECVPRAQ